MNDLPVDDLLTCKPLKTYKELLDFVDDPPAWRSLCADIKQHSKYLIKNHAPRSSRSYSQFLLRDPQIFCHFDPDADEPKRYKKELLSKTLVCHDMANGYHDDSKIDGTNQFDAYTFYNWAGIDIFCYFSHHLITIPPVGWINVGHEHGVKVIGTIITEWENGTEFWTKVLSSELETQNCISALVTVAKTLNFDGWLLNVENKVNEPELLLEFVRKLHATLHHELSDAVLIWYDSVTVDGLLSWQNKLNDKNKCFFDACDGLFTNYSWKTTDLLESVKAAGSRLYDLYIGIDVWGRNFLGGGQFNTQEAIQIAHSLGCSLAIFAPAWTHEAIGDGKDKSDIINGEGLTNYEKFLLRDRALWDSIWPFLNTRLPSTLPFKTSFCRGQGMKRRLYGEVLGPTPWYNLRHMQYQLNSVHGPHGYLLMTRENYSKAFILESSSIQQTDSNKARKLRDVSSTASLETDHECKSRRILKRIIRQVFRRIKSRTNSEISSSGSSSVSSGTVMVADETEAGSSADLARLCLAHMPYERECLEIFYGDSFIGGSCLKINPSDKHLTEHRTIRLFHCDFHCEDTLIFCFVTKHLPENESQWLNLHLYALDSNNKDVRVALIGRNMPMQHGPSSRVTNYYPYPHTASEFRDMQKYILLNQPDFYVPIENSYNWAVWYFEVQMPNVRITSINCRTGSQRGAILLGHLGLCHKIRTQKQNR